VIPWSFAMGARIYSMVQARRPVKAMMQKVMK
jgi:hypothetical protein